MSAFFKRAMRAGLAFVTRRIIREALASAIVTMIVTVAFTGTHSEAPAPSRVAAAPSLGLTPAVAATIAPPSSADFAKVWFDPSLAPPALSDFQLQGVGAKPRRQRSRAVQTAAHAVAPARRASDRTGSIRARAAGAPTLVAETGAAPKPVEDNSFRVFGVAPLDYVPTPAGIVNGAKSVGTTIASVAGF